MKSALSAVTTKTDQTLSTSTVVKASLDLQSFWLGPCPVCVQSFQENSHVNINVLVAQNPLVPLIGRLVACSARTRTDRRTDKQTKYCNPRCACAPRVNHHDYGKISSWSKNFQCRHNSSTFGSVTQPQRVLQTPSDFSVPPAACNT